MGKKLIDYISEGKIPQFGRFKCDCEDFEYHVNNIDLSRDGNLMLHIMLEGSQGYRVMSECHLE